jgi:hypothetical protein
MRHHANHAGYRVGSGRLMKLTHPFRGDLSIICDHHHEKQKQLHGVAKVVTGLTFYVDASAIDR